jgi:hypothetical protein
MNLRGAVALAVLSSVLAISSGTSGRKAEVQASAQAGDEDANVISCRVLEAHTSEEPAVTVAVFHQSQTADRERLASFLKANSDGAVEYWTGSGQWKSARVARLKSCFGRGLLLAPAGDEALKQGATFSLRLPSTRKPSSQ